MVAIIAIVVLGIIFIGHIFQIDDLQKRIKKLEQPK